MGRFQVFKGVITAPMVEAMDELTLASVRGFKSKHDDFIDTISMLGVLTAWKPSQVTPEPKVVDRYYGDEWAPEDTTEALDLYIV